MKRLLVLLLFLPCIAWATGNSAAPSANSTALAGASASLKATQSQVANFASFSSLSLSAPTSAYIGGQTSNTYSFSAPSFSNASQCPIGVIPLIGGTTGAEFCRAFWIAMVSGDRGPVCGNSFFREDLDEFCADWDKAHPKASDKRGFKWSLEP